MKFKLTDYELSDLKKSFESIKDHSDGKINF